MKIFKNLLSLNTLFVLLASFALSATSVVIADEKKADAATEEATKVEDKDKKEVADTDKKATDEESKDTDKKAEEGESKDADKKAATDDGKEKEKGKDKKKEKDGEEPECE